jgi:hypothetical protein
LSSIRQSTRQLKIQLTYTAIRPFVVIAICLALLAVTAFGIKQANAQGILTNGAVIKGSITDQTKILVYSYIAAVGDLIDTHVMGTSPGMNPNLSLLSPTQQQLVTNDDDPFSTLDSTDSRISYLVQTPGVYSFLVSGTNGDFMLRFTVRKVGNGTPLKLNTPLEVNLQAANINAYSFAADPANPQNLSIASTSAGFAFSAQIYDPAGQLVAVLGSPSILSGSVIIGPAGRNTPAKGNYQVFISPLLPNTQGTVSILIGAAQPINEAPESTNGKPSPTTPPPTVTPSPIPPTNTPTPIVTPTQTPIPINPLAPAGVCSGTPLSKVVNVRSGPGTNYPVIGPLQPGVFLVLHGRSEDGQWYVNTDDANKQLWVALQVISLSGPCDKVPVVPAPPIPPTSTFTPSPTPQVFAVTATPTAKILVQPKSTSSPIPTKAP